MAAVTVTTGYPKMNVSGYYRTYYYLIDIAADGDTLTVPLKNIKSVHLTDVALTACGVASVVESAASSLITFNSGGAITGCYVTVVGQ